MSLKYAVLDSQHGFVLERSCTSHLLETLKAWTQLLDGRRGTGVDYAGFQKALDCLPHCSLLGKGCSILDEMKATNMNRGAS